MGPKFSLKKKELMKSYEEAGIKFTAVDNKSIRLYFQSQFTNDIEDEDLKYLKHIFEIKTYLYFNNYYSSSNLLNTKKFLEETFEKTIEAIYTDIKDLEIIEAENDDQQDEIIDEFFNFQLKKTEESIFYTCKINYFLRSLKEVSPQIELSEEFRNKIANTKELEIYTLLNDNTNVIYLVLSRIFETYNHNNLNKISVYQVGLKTIDEFMYTVLANFLRKNPQIESVHILEKNWKSLKHIDMQGEADYFDNEEKLENPIINRQHFFNFYQSLAVRHNLQELSVLLFLNDYNFVMLTQVININKGLKSLKVRNVSRENDVMRRELDFCYNELNMMGENLRDEIFIFFNYLSQLEELEHLALTNFSFNSEINFLACESAKQLKKLKSLSLDNNHAIINNDTTALDQYNFEQTNLVKLNLGLSYLNMIRRFDYIVNVDFLKEINIGVLDFVSFSAFVRFVPRSCLERVTLTLNKPTEIRSIPFLFEQIYQHCFKSKTLKYLYVLNAYTQKTYNDKSMNVFLVKLIEKMKENSTVRKLSFKKPCILYTSIRESEAERANGVKTFRYINKRDYSTAVSIIIAMKQVFKFEDEIGGRFYHESEEPWMRYINEANESRRDKFFFYNRIFKNIVQFNLASYRKIVLE